jgi:hypothetical protein
MYKIPFERQETGLSILVNFHAPGFGFRTAKSVRIRIHNTFMYSYIYFTYIFVRNRWDKLLFAPLDQGELKWGSINKAVNEIINSHPGKHIFEVENLVSVASFVQFLSPDPYPTNKSY